MLEEQKNELLEMSPEELSLAFLCLLGVVSPPPSLAKLNLDEWATIGEVLLELQKEQARSTVH